MNSFPELVSNGRDIALFMGEGKGLLFEEIGNLNLTYSVHQDIINVSYFGDSRIFPYEGLKSYDANVSFFAKSFKSISEKEIFDISPKTFSELTILEVFNLIDKKLDRRERKEKIEFFNFPLFISNRDRLVLITDKSFYVNMEKPIMVNYSLSSLKNSLFEIRIDFKNGGKCYTGLVEDLDLVMNYTLQNKSIGDLLKIIDNKLGEREEREEEKNVWMAFGNKIK